MTTQLRRHATTAGFVGAALWIFASVASALEEIEYEDATRPSPFPPWVVPLAIAAGAVSIAAFVHFSGKPRGRASRLSILIGAAISLVPLWPFLVLGPFLIAIGFFGSAVAAWFSGHHTTGTLLHALGLPLSIPVGALALRTTGMDEEYGVVVFMAVLALGIVMRATEPDEREEPVGAIEEELARTPG